MVAEMETENAPNFEYAQHGEIKSIPSQGGPSHHQVGFAVDQTSFRAQCANCFHMSALHELNDVHYMAAVLDFNLRPCTGPV